MHLYMSGTPSNDHFQVIENQICSHRLFSMHGEYAAEVVKWLDPIKAGVRTFDDYCKFKPDTRRRLERNDKKQRALFLEHGIEDEWVPLEDALRAASDKHEATYPRNIMLDSGAFTAWNAGNPANLDEVKRAYAAFMAKADGLFDEIWMINLDVIPGEKGKTPTAAEKNFAIAESDKNLDALRAEFGDNVMPVFHQGESKERLLSVVDQAKGYLCLSPVNSLPEEQRWRWAKLARFALSDLDCDVRTHGLATTGNDMVREAELLSGDSAAWKQHGFFGLVDLVQDERTLGEHFDIGELRDGAYEHLDVHIVESTRKRYKGYHIAAELNDSDLGTGKALIDNDRHVTFLPEQEQEWVRSRVEKYVPWSLAQYSQRARNLVCMGEMQSFAESVEWKEPRPTVYADGVLVDKSSPLHLELRPYPLPADRARFLADTYFDGHL